MRRRPEYDMKIIGKNLKRLRLAKGFTVNEVKEYLNLGSVQAVYKYESGRGYPQADTMLALLELYEAELGDIVCQYHEELHLEYEMRNSQLQKKQQLRRLYRYVELFIENGIAS